MYTHYNPHKKYCIFGCGFFIQHNVVMHRFPHPVKRAKLFNAWMEVVGHTLRGKDDDHMKIYKSRKVCDYHFESNQKTSGRRLIWSAIPSVNLKRMQPTIADIVDTDHCYSVPKRDFTEPTLLTNVTNVPEPSTSGSMCTADSTVIQSPLECEELQKPFSWEDTDVIIADDIDVSDDIMEASGLVLDSGDVSMYGDCDEQPKHNDTDDRWVGYRCNECGEINDCFRYTCVQCADWHLCAACEARGAHDAHYVLRVPGHRPYNEIQAVLAAIRQQILSENLFLPEIIACVKVEANDEEAELPQGVLEPEVDPLGGWEWDSGQDGDCHIQENYPERNDEDGSPSRKRRRTGPDSIYETQNCTPRSCIDLVTESDDDSTETKDLSVEYCEPIEVKDVDKPIETSEQIEVCEKNDIYTIQTKKGSHIKMSLSKFLELSSDLYGTCVSKPQQKGLDTLNNVSSPKTPFKITNRTTTYNEKHSERIGTHSEGIKTDNKVIKRHDKETEIIKGIGRRSEGSGTRSKIIIGPHSERSETRSKIIIRPQSDGSGTRSKIIIGPHSERSETRSKIMIGPQSEGTGTLSKIIIGPQSEGSGPLSKIEIGPQSEGSGPLSKIKLVPQSEGSGPLSKIKLGPQSEGSGPLSKIKLGPQSEGSGPLSKIKLGPQSEGSGPLSKIKIGPQSEGSGPLSKIKIGPQSEGSGSLSKIKIRPQSEGSGPLSKIKIGPQSEGSGPLSKIIIGPQSEGYGTRSKIIIGPQSKGSGTLSKIIIRPQSEGSGTQSKIIIRPHSERRKIKMGTHSKRIIGHSKGIRTRSITNNGHWNRVINTMLKSQVTVQLEDVMRKNRMQIKTEINEI